jgi:hypothetical protein
MSVLLRIALLFCAMLALSPSSVRAADAPREADWLELMPKDEVDALMNAQASVAMDHENRGAQTGTFNTVNEMDGQRIKLAGYIVPSQTTEDGKLSEFFLVPYFGACIHVPPPPPNQIILARAAKPIDMTEIYDAFWVTGTLNVEKTESEIAATAYTLDVEAVKLYE